MSSSELSDDEYGFDEYCKAEDQYSQDQDGNLTYIGPPLITTKARLISAAGSNDVETLRQLLDSPKWYRIRDKHGLNLLHIVILSALQHANFESERYEVFDYLLSLRDFPLDEVDKAGYTALAMAIERLSISHIPAVYERCALELIKNGADIHIECKGDPPLHITVKNSVPTVLQSLIERGVDINELNQEGLTPLHCCVDRKYCNNNVEEGKKAEIITMLLCYGADPSIRDASGFTALNYLLTYWRFTVDSSILVALENLFYFTVDEWSPNEISANGLLKLAEIKSPLFDQMVKFISESSEIFYNEYDVPISFLFSSFDSEYLRILLEKCPGVIEVCLQSYSDASAKYTRFDKLKLENFEMLRESLLWPDIEVCLQSYSDESAKYTRFDKLNLENFEMLRESLLWPDTLEFILKLDSKNTNTIIRHNLDSDKNLDEFFELLYYLLSCGMVLDEIDLIDIYEKSGYSKDFKNLLFMDIENKCERGAWRKWPVTMPRLTYDVTLDIHKMVENPLSFVIDWDQIFPYFAHQKIQNAFHIYQGSIYCELKYKKIIDKQLPQVPLLMELARDSFRRYFVRTFNITTAKQFYTLLRALPISLRHEEIITYERKLYSRIL